MLSAGEIQKDCTFFLLSGNTENEMNLLHCYHHDTVWQIFAICKRKEGGIP